MRRPRHPALTIAASSEDRGGSPRLRRPAILSPWGSLLLRATIVLSLIAVAFTGHWFDRAGYKDNLDGEISLVDAAYFTAVTITTVGYGDIVPVSPRARLFDAFVVTPIRLFIWLLFIGTAYNFVVARSWEKWRMKSIQNGLSDHYIVAGYGTTGGAAVHELLANGVLPDKIVVIDPSHARVQAALGDGVLGLEGDATRNETLNLARIEAAVSFVACGGRDDTSALLVLSARQLAPDIRISAIIKAEENESLVKKAGADTVINPVALGGHLLARAAGGSYVVDYITDLVVAEGRVQLIERPARMDELGKPLKACETGLGTRIIRDGQPIGFWEEAASSIEAGDIIVEIVPKNGAD